MKNVFENKKEGTFTVQTPNGKTRVFKTLRGAENHAAKHARIIQVPQIVTANTYFWSSAGNASGRRSNEKRRNAEIEAFVNEFSAIPMIIVEGDYRETCSNVYKSMGYKILKNDEFVSTNLTGFISECARWGLTLIK